MCIPVLLYYWVNKMMMMMMNRMHMQLLGTVVDGIQTVTAKD